VKVAGAVAVTAGCVLLVARPALVGWSSHPTVLLLGLFTALALTGLMWPGVPSGGSAVPRRLTAAVAATGAATFALGRILGGGRAPVAASLTFVALNAFAAVAEELFFRRLVYGLLLPAGPLYAIGGSAALFAIVHVTTYGYWVLPIDVAAGLVLGWQRWSTSTWLVPAATHVAANVLVVI
jgi:hypothetical protein